MIVTTPNVEHNVRFETLPAGAMRHRDHRFEWTRAQFADWADRVADAYGYTVRYLPVGADDPEVGPPTQLAVFTARSEPRDDAASCDRVPELSLVVLIGVSAARASRPSAAPTSGPTEVISSRLLPRPGRRRRERPGRHAAGVRAAALHRRQCGCKAGRLTVVDATNVQPEAREAAGRLAREHDVLPVAIVLDVPERVVPRAQRGAARPRLRRRT